MEVFETHHPTLRNFIVNIIFMNEGPGPLGYTAFPATITATGIYRGVEMVIAPGKVTMTQAATKGCTTIMYGLLESAVRIHLEHVPNAIGINFRPGCAPAFIPRGCSDRSTHIFDDWGNEANELYESVFATFGKERLALVEEFLLARFAGIDHYSPYHRAAQLLSDFEQEHSVMQVADTVGLPYKFFYRHFTKVFGCSPAHYKNIARFRKSVYDWIGKQQETRLTDISYGNNYTDQSYFIKEFRRYTGENPKDFFKHITVLGNNKIVWKFEEGSL